MSSSTYVYEVRFVATKRGRRAYRTVRRSFRWFPMPTAEADLAVATGAAVDVTAEHAALAAEAAR